MFNVYPVEISYTITPFSGVLAGHPVNCVIGVASEAAGKKLFDQMIKDQPKSKFTNFKIKKK